MYQLIIDFIFQYFSPIILSTPFFKYPTHKYRKTSKTENYIIRALYSHITGRKSLRLNDDKDNHNGLHEYFTNPTAIQILYG